MLYFGIINDQSNTSSFPSHQKSEYHHHHHHHHQLHLKLPKKHDKMNPIHEAAVVGNIEQLKLLIENGTNINLKDSKGLRPLHYAAWQGRAESVFLLLRCNANVNEQSLDGDTPLHLASQYGHHEIVQLLLFHHADPTILNRRLCSAIELACEYGHFHVVNLLVHNKLCQQIILNNNNHNNSTIEQNTPLHLAAKNGHSDIIRLLLLKGMDINRMTINDGTALHAACRNGRYDTAKLLLECGIDIHLRNSYDQTAYEVVIKQKSGNDIKRLIKEFSDAITVRAIRTYKDNHVGALNFSEGDCITVLDRNPTGQWRGFILQDDLTTRTGYFPSTYVKLTTNIINGREIQSYTDNHSPIDIDCMSRSSQADSGVITTTTTATTNWGSRTKRSSPPNSSYRNSAASSIDSGRSSTVLYDNPKALTLSSFTGIGDARSICSSSNESKSSDPDKTSYRSSNSSLDESGTQNIIVLLRKGVSDSDIIFSWLREFSYENYAENFITNGYDIQTIVRMTPEDLTAIGITHPVHRRKIKSEITRLRLPDGIPDFQPDTIYDWLAYLRLEEYLPLLNQQNYKILSDIMSIAWEDLEDIGITRLGHQKRFMLGIKRLIDIDKGLYPSNSRQIKSSSLKQTKRTLERCNSLENNEFLQQTLNRSSTDDGSSNYATLRRAPFSPNLSTSKQRVGSSRNHIPGLSFRLPPPLSSPITNSTINHYQSVISNRTRSLENININERKLNANQYESVSSPYGYHSRIVNNLPLLNDINLSSSAESINGIPFAKENIGTIKQRSPTNHYNSITIDSSMDTMKRSLPNDFFQQTNKILINKTHMPNYDNNECCFRKDTSTSPYKQKRKVSMPSTNEHLVSSSSTVDKPSQFIEPLKSSKHNRLLKNDTTNVLSDIDTMLSDLNRELDQMLDYEATTSIRR